jgi:hypothetical protein
VNNESQPTYKFSGVIGDPAGWGDRRREADGEQVSGRPDLLKGEHGMKNHGQHRDHVGHQEVDAEAWDSKVSVKLFSGKPVEPNLRCDDWEHTTVIVNAPNPSLKHKEPKPELIDSRSKAALRVQWQKLLEIADRGNKLSLT